MKTFDKLGISFVFLVILYSVFVFLLPTIGYCEPRVSKICDEFKNRTNIEHCEIALWGLGPCEVNQIKACENVEDGIYGNCQDYWVKKGDGRYIFREVSGDKDE